MLDNIPEEIKNIEQFLVWKLEKLPDVEKLAKIPYNPNNHWKCAVTKIENYSDFYKAKEVFKKSDKKYSGLGFGLFPKGELNDITVIDFDNVLDQSGELLPQYEEIAEWTEDFNTYTEISQSGKGLHLFFYGSPPGNTTRKAICKFPVEIYCKGRYIAITGNVWHGYNKIRSAQETLTEFYYYVFGKDSNNQRHEEINITNNRSDETILKIISHSKSAGKFNDLFLGNGCDDNSANDQSLCNMIAFYTQDHDQIIRIMRKSALVRDKWERKDYLERTIKKAILALTNTFDWEDADRKNNEWKNRPIQEKPIQEKPIQEKPIQENEELPIFWYEKANEKTGEITIKISESLLMDFFKKLGYKKLFSSSDTKTDIVLTNRCFIENTGTQDIISMLVKYIQKPEFKDICFELANLMPKLNQSLNSNYWRILDQIHPKTNIDTLKTGYHFFKNGIVKITEKEISITNYSDFSGIVWKHQINNYDYKNIGIKGEFETFCENTQRDALGNINPIRWSSFKSFIGYALHKYHNPSNARACIIQDEAIRHYKTEANGGTGKSIIAKAIQLLRPGFYLDCKMADFKNDAFLYDGANQADQTLIYDDVKNSFPFEFVYNQVERPAMINAKGKNKVPFNDVPKYIITSNSVIETESESSKRRIAMIFCGGHYNVKNTPIMEFGHNLFNDWQEGQ